MLPWKKSFSQENDMKCQDRCRFYRSCNSRFQVAETKNKRRGVLPENRIPEDSSSVWHTAGSLVRTCRGLPVSVRLYLCSVVQYKKNLNPGQDASSRNSVFAASIWLCTNSRRFSAHNFAPSPAMFPTASIRSRSTDGIMPMRQAEAGFI